VTGRPSSRPARGRSRGQPHADHGILVSTDGPFHNVIKIKPPLCFSEADADRLVATLDGVLGEDYLQA